MISLNDVRAEHPRLLLTNEQCAELKAQIAVNDSIPQRFFEQVKKQAEQQFDKPPIKHGLLHGRMLHVAQELASRIYPLALTYRVTEDERFARCAINNLMTAAQFPDWNHGHGLDFAEFSHAVGLGYDWLYHAMNEEERALIGEALFTHGTERALAQWASKNGPKWMQTNLRDFNWNLVCNGGLLVGALAIADEKPEQTIELINTSLKHMPRALKQFRHDGLSAEGTCYWKYALQYLLVAIESLETAVGHDDGLSQHQGLAGSGRAMVLSRGPSGDNMYFADDKSVWLNEDGDWELFWLSKRYGDPLPAEEEHARLNNRPAVAQHLIRYVSPPKEQSERPLLHWLRGRVDLVTMRTAWQDPEALWVGIKGGYNRINHGHMDLGVFELEAAGVRWAVDLGKEDYQVSGYWDRHTDDGKRWQYYIVGSEGHNVPRIDRENQLLDGAASMLVANRTKKSARTALDLTSAYAHRASRVWRGVEMAFDDKTILVQDEFHLFERCEVEWAMLTMAEVTIEGALAVLEQDGKQLYLTLHGLPGAFFEAVSAERAAPESANTGVTRLYVRHEAEGKVRFGVRFALSDAAAKTEGALTPLATWIAEAE